MIQATQNGGEKGGKGKGGKGKGGASRFQVKVPIKKRLVPFGVGQHKPKHFRDMFKIVWENSDNPIHAWNVLSKGVCDGCALGVAGFHDWTIKGVHLCMTRLNLLRLNTMPAMDHSLLEDVSQLEGISNKKLRKLGRLAYPMLRKKGDKGFTQITWDEAYDRMADKIRSIDPSRMAFFVTSRGVTNEVYYMAQKVARFLGTNSVDNAARICHSPSTAALKRSTGIAATTCSYKDWYGTDLIIFFGANPANDQPVTTKYLHEAKLKGTKVVFVNPYLEPGMECYWVPSTAESALFGTPIVDYWYPVSQKGDIAFLYGVIKILLEENWIDEKFVKERTADIEDLRKACDALKFEDLEKQAGLDVDAMRAFAEQIRDAKNAVLVWSMGITQHEFGADAVQMIVNLGLMRGYVGKDLNGLMPIRGHSSVQGGAEMGAYSTAFPGGKPVNEENAKALEAHYGFPILSKPGLTTTEMIEAGDRGDLDFFYCLGGNMLRNLPDPDHVVKSFKKMPMRIHQDIIVTDQMLIDTEGEVLLLPAATRYEQEDGGIETITERRIVFTPQIPRQVGEAKTEWRILRDLAERTYPDRAEQLGCETGWKMREEIAKVVPIYEGCQNLKKTGDAIQYGGPHLCPDGVFETPDTLGHFFPVDVPDFDQPEGTFIVSTRRGKQFNSLIYAEIDPLNNAPREAVLMNEEDAAKLHLMNGDPIRLSCSQGTYDGVVHLAPIAPRNLQVHWPEGNVLIPKGIVDRGGGVPDYNAFVTVEKL